MSSAKGTQETIGRRATAAAVSSNARKGSPRGTRPLHPPRSSRPAERTAATQQAAPATAGSQDPGAGLACRTPEVGPGEVQGQLEVGICLVMEARHTPDELSHVPLLLFVQPGPRRHQPGHIPGVPAAPSLYQVADVLARV